MSAVSDSDFERLVLHSHKPVLVHFSGAKDGGMGPALDALADRLGGRAHVAHIALSANAALGAQYGVFGPALVYFEDGVVAGRRAPEGDVGELFGWLEGLGIGCACHPD